MHPISSSSAPSVLHQPLSAAHPHLIDLSLALWSPQPQHLPGRGGDPTGLQRPQFPIHRSDDSHGQGRRRDKIMSGLPDSMLGSAVQNCCQAREPHPCACATLCFLCTANIKQPTRCSVVQPEIRKLLI